MIATFLILSSLLVPICQRSFHGLWSSTDMTWNDHPCLGMRIQFLGSVNPRLFQQRELTIL